MADQLFSVLLTAYNVILDEVHEAEGVWSMFKVKIETLATIFLLDAGGLLLGIMLQDKLLEEQESPLVIH